MLHQGNYFVVSVKFNFCWSKINFNLIDTYNEFTECEIPRKKLQSISISPVSLNTFMKALKSNISEAFEVKFDGCYDKNDMKEKVSDLARLHEAMKEKLKTASYSKQTQILNLVPDKWY